MIARTAEELIKHSKTMLIHDATKIMREHNFAPCVVWGRETGELLVDLVNQEVICPVGKLDGCIDTKALIEWLGY